jgi:group I intron endonuclease
MKMGFIYKITSPVGKVYIGQTLDPIKRQRTYKSFGCKQQPKVFYSLTKYTWEAHTFEIIESIEFDSVSEINEREKYWIKYFNSLNEGLNCTGGGDSKEISPETIEKIRLSKLGKPSPNKGKKLNEEQLKRKSLAMIGNKNNRYCKK